MSFIDKFADIFFFERYLKGKDVVPIVRRIVDPLLTINISSYFFERFYFKYQWLDVTDYKSILNFFVKGSFIIPLSIFLVVHFTVRGISVFIFNKIKKSVIKYFEKSLSLKGEDSAFYERLKIFLETKETKRIPAITMKLKREVEERYHFVFKIILVTVLYYCILPNYGVFLFILMLILLLGLLAGILLVYLLFDLIPTAFKNLQKAVKQELQERKTDTIDRDLTNAAI